MSSTWFDISNEGWRNLNAGRPLATLLEEALQNALDQDASRISVSIKSKRIEIEDNGSRGFLAPEQIYTIYVSDKGDDPTKRGRYGRGIKELIAATQQAEVDTVGFTVRFDDDGRHVDTNRRKSGTRIILHRTSTPEEVEHASRTLAMLIADDGIAVKINGKTVKRPKPYAKLRSCRLETVVYEGGVERAVPSECAVTLYLPRKAEVPHIFEMGLPVQPSGTPWHIDVGQRIPLRAGRDRISDNYRLQVLTLLFETLVPRGLPQEALKDPWLSEVVDRAQLSDEALRAYVKAKFPEGAVLPTSAHHDDQAAQRGARILDTGALSTPAADALARVLETSEQYVARVRTRAEPVQSAHPTEQRAVSFYADLAKRILGRPIKVRLVRKPLGADGVIESATFDAERDELNINVEGHMDLQAPLSRESLGIFFHELAHAHVQTHDREFIRHLERIAGEGARVLALEGRDIAAQHGITFDES